MGNPSPENKRIAKYALKAFGDGTPKVLRICHDYSDIYIDMCCCINSPCDGITSYSTIGLSDYAMLEEDGSEYPVRVEIAAACASIELEFPNLIGTAAINVIRNHRIISPGACMENYVDEYYKGTHLPHLYFTAPFLWDELTTLDCQSKKATWLLAMPISQSELKYLVTYGSDKLEDVFEQKQIDFFDIRRPSTL